MSLVPLSWEELINYNKKTNYKNRPIIIVELDDEMNRKYNAIVVKHDEKKNVLIRYLDNPFFENKYWWTGNKDSLAGLNPLSYHAKFLGDKYNEMEGLQKSDFQEDGYDDIINYGEESHRFFHTTDKYPYLSGIQGNVHVNNYYVSQFNQCLSEGGVPNCIKRKIPYIPKRLGTPKNEDTIYYNILDGMKEDEYPMVLDYKKYRNNVKKVKKIILEFKKMLSFMMTNYFIKTHSSEMNIDVDELLTIKSNLRDGKSSYNLYKIIPRLIGYSIVIFNCNENDLSVEKYDVEDNKNTIYILRYLDGDDSLVEH
jgi:hypothetical protein